MRIKQNLYLSGLRYALIVGLMMMYSCKKSDLSTIAETDPDTRTDHRQSLSTLDSNRTEVSLTISESATGVNVPANFIGLSYEKSDLVNPLWPYFNANQTVFLQLMKNLKTGVLRLGGNSSDKIKWYNALRGGSTSITEVYQNDVYKLKLFMDQLGTDWKLVYGLNLANDTVHVSEVDYVHTQFGSKVLSFEIGN
jgi:hypothetical protein